MPFDNFSSYRLAGATRAFRPYFGLSSFQDLVAELQFRGQVGNLRQRNFSAPLPGSLASQQGSERRGNTHPSWLVQVFDAVFNVGDGAYPVTSQGTNNLRQIIGDFGTTPANQQQPFTEQAVRDAVEFYYAGAGDPNSFDHVIFKPAMNNLLGGNPPQQETDTWKRLVAAKVNSPYLNPALKNVDLATVFFNGMPSVELARCVPYLDLMFTFGRPTTDTQGRLNAPSIYKFLLGAKNINQGTSQTERTIILGSAATTPGSSSAGLELFTTPQTLINAAVNTESDPHSLRATPVLDPFRPFMSLKGVAIDVAPTIGFFSNKTAKVEMVLHDRSRLHEVAEFVKPDFRGNTEINLTYGWSHPDGPEVGNPYSDMMNGSRITESYKIRNSQFSFDEVGQVNISLDLFTAGTHDLNTLTITEGDSNTTAIERTVAEIREAMSVLQGGGSTSGGGNSGARPTEIRGIQTLASAVDSRNLLRLSTAQNNDLRALRTLLRGRPYQGAAAQGTSIGRAASQLAHSLDDLIGATPRGVNTSQVGRLRTSIAEAFSRHASAVLNSDPTTNDPFYPASFRVPGSGGRNLNLSTRNLAAPTGNSSTPAASSPSLEATAGVRAGINNGNAVSLGKILLNFVGKPLAATGRYEEVQMFFYPFNESAGYASQLNIGELPVNKRFFAEQYLRFRMESISRSANMTLQDFVAWLAGIIIDDMGNPAYGISNLFRSTSRGENRNVEAGTEIANASNFQVELEQRLRDVTPNGDFKHPTVQCYVEATPVKTSTPNGGNRAPDFTKKILRLHFFDRQSTSYSSQASILQASRAQQLASFGSIPALTGSVTSAQRLARYNEIIDQAIHSKLIAREGTEYRVVGGFNRIKEFLYDTMPFIIYGAQGTTIKTAQLTSQQNELLGSVNMIRSLQATPITANGEQPGGLPLQIIPAELGVSMMGCTLVDIFQQYFIDFKTGTSADNIYVVNGVSHKIDPGSFTTDLKFVFYDGYGHYQSFLGNIRSFRERIAAEQATAPAAPPNAPPRGTRRPARSTG